MRVHLVRPDFSARLFRQLPRRSVVVLVPMRNDHTVDVPHLESRRLDAIRQMLIRPRSPRVYQRHAVVLEQVRPRRPRARVIVLRHTNRVNLPPLLRCQPDHHSVAVCVTFANRHHIFELISQCKSPFSVKNRAIRQGRRSFWGKKWVGWVRRFELPISRATTWRLNRLATPTTHKPILAVSKHDGQPFPSGAKLPLRR